VVFHCHDEVVIEVPEGSITEAEVLAILLEPPAWAEGLPLGGKVHSGQIYLEAPATAEPPEPETEQDLLERAIDALVAETPPNPAIAKAADEDFLASLGTEYAPLADFCTLPMDASGKVSCPFHDDPSPSCKIYSDHFHCFGCGRRGSRLDWLTEVEGMTEAEAIHALQDWSGPASTQQKQDITDRVALAQRLWNEAQRLRGTIGERYLAETRGIDTEALSPTIGHALRFHPHCIFGSRNYAPCILALMRDPLTDTPTGIHRIGVAERAGSIIKLDRLTLGRLGVVKLWPLSGDQLVVGEGVETTLAAATRLTHHGAPLRPAWSAVAKGGLGKLPVVPDVHRLILLVDHDLNGEGQKAAQFCREVWRSAGRTVVPLLPKEPGTDFNDAIMRKPA
jgi:hypothetical protein